MKKSLDACKGVGIKPNRGYVFAGLEGSRRVFADTTLQSITRCVLSGGPLKMSDMAE